MGRYNQEERAQRERYLIHPNINDTVIDNYERYLKAIKDYPLDAYENRTIWDQYLRTLAAHHKYTEKHDEQQTIEFQVAK